VEHRTGHFAGVGGLRIFWQAWLPDAEPRAVIGMAHGLSEHSGRYAWTGEQLAARGYALYALDHRGHGQSEGPRAVVDRMSNAVADLGTLLELAARGSGVAEKPFLFGHSMGGCIALAFATRRQDEIRGLLLSAPLAVLEAASPIQRFAAHAISVIAPKTGLYEIDSSTVSRDPEVVRDYDSDPLNYRGKVPARTIHELAQEIARFDEEVPRITVPLFVQVGTGDKLVPPRASELVYERASSRDKTIKRYDGLYHEILNEAERDRVVSDMLDWLDAHAGSEAERDEAAASGRD
jgi:acylglycerol lipase